MNISGISLKLILSELWGDTKIPLSICDLNLTERPNYVLHGHLIHIIQFLIHI